jgi:plastocyanin
MIEVKMVVRGVALGIVMTQLVAPRPVNAAQDPTARPAPTGAEFARLEAQVNEQRQLIIQLMQSEQQRYEMLLKLIGNPAGASSAALPAPVVAPTAEIAAPASTGAGKAAVAAASPALPQRKVAPIDGKVSISGGDLADIYIFVENVRGAPVRGRTIEIKQENKQFSPRLAVVQAGTQVVFPNLDTVFHNVFSNSPKNSFDLGSYRSGDKPRSVIMTSPGLVEIFCNVHQKMNANVMVVPNNLYTKVKSDGSFHIENVPVGARKLVAWSPNTKLAAQKIDVTSSGAQTSFNLEYEEAQAHANKTGLPYGSYK